MWKKQILEIRNLFLIVRQILKVAKNIKVIQFPEHNQLNYMKAQKI